ncbi:MAG: aromatic amino acid ammonia-lyase [Myxococcota bacterium]|nr:aromatic amino acid ammonia-lyase [Myxococcota bacterium]
MGRPLRLADVLALASGRVKARLSTDPAWRDRIRRARAVIDDRPGAVYGVTTGVGASVDVEIPAELRDEMPHHLLRFHGCGTGALLSERESAAVVAVRLATLATGHSGVRPELLERLCELLNHRVLPAIPEEGSVGASGDLTPLSYLAAVLIGEREVLGGPAGTRSAAEALAEAGIEPLTLAAKESLSLMNGTTVMTAVACLATARARELSRLAATATAILSDVTHGNPEHFDARIFEWKPHPGSVTAARWIREGLEGAGQRTPARLQDRYSLRCAPHVIGVLLDATSAAESILEIEINAVDDNPLVDPDARDVLHGGNFYGGHVAMAMDGLKAAVASLADLFDRQLCLLCVPETSDDLPPNLVIGEGPERVVHHGFKAMQISASALTAEALKLTMPASAFSRSTESHNQDKVSMGTIAARDARRVLELCESVGAMLLLALGQAVDLRTPEASLLPSARFHAALRKHVPPVTTDRRQDRDIDTLLRLLSAGELPLLGESDSSAQA